MLKILYSNSYGVCSCCCLRNSIRCCNINCVHSRSFWSFCFREIFSTGDNFDAAAGDNGGLSNAEGSKGVVASVDCDIMRVVDGDDAAISASSDRLLLLPPMLAMLLLLQSRSEGDACGEHPPSAAVDERKDGESIARGGGGKGDNTSRNSGDKGCCSDAAGDIGGDGAEREQLESMLCGTVRKNLIFKEKRCKDLLSALTLTR